MNSWIIVDIHAAAAKTARAPSFGQHALDTVLNRRGPAQHAVAAKNSVELRTKGMGSRNVAGLLLNVSG
jgi:hypothetical protein